MNGTAPSNPGQVFATDLRKIREARGISIEQLHDETKIPRGLIDSFEESGLVDHPMFNRVYLRSFVRTYAEVVGISTDVALASLDEALDDQYSDSLAVAYLERPEPEELAEPEPGAPMVSPDEEPVDAFEEELSPGLLETEVEPEEDVSAGYELESPADEDVEIVEEEIQPVRTIPQAEYPVEPEPPITPVATTSTVGSVAPSIPQPYRRRDLEAEGSSRRWIWIAAGIVVLAVLAFIIIRMAGGSGEGEVAATEPAATAATADSTTATALPPIEIGDSLDVNIIAAGGPVQDIKVTVDDDVRRPYWIEQGESRLFQAADRLVIERELDQVQLQLEGRSYPTDNVDEQGRIVITREGAAAFLGQNR